ncbi:MAG: dihydroorotase [Elainellaceae cyanobacterium]
MTTELIRNVRVLNPLLGTDQVADVCIVDGVIEAIRATPRQANAPPSSLSSATESADTVIDQLGLVLAPALVDLYSHSGEPGNESRETLESLVEAAIAGGFSRLTLLPDTQPVLDQPAVIQQIQQRVQQFAQAPRLTCWGAITQGCRGEQMTELGELATVAAGFSDGQPLPNPVLLQRVLDYAQTLGKPIALWPCDRALTGDGVVREGHTSIRLGLPGIPALAETAALAVILECVAEVQTPVHLMRISTARSVELIREAKQRGLPITASTTWMHLLLDVDAVATYHPALHLDPPLGNAGDRQALIKAVQTGVIDAIAIDHAPYTYEEKTVAFSESPPGAIGLELALPLLWSALVESGLWSALDLWNALSFRPSQCLDQEPPQLAIGSAAEMVLFDPKAKWTVSRTTLKSLSTNTSWLGQTLTGAVLKTWIP